MKAETYITKIWFLFAMSMHVKGQVVDLMEGLIADVAFVGFVVAVR